MKTVEVLSLPPSIDPFGHVYWEIIGSCNGLLCVVVDPASSRSPCSLWLWNPEIREVREVPQTTNDYWDKCQFGFGYSSVLSDHKIVRFCHKQGRRKKEDAIWGYDIKVEVFSLNTSSWKELESGASQNTEIIFPTISGSADGTIVWLGRQDHCPVVVSFTIVTEVFTFTPIPFARHHLYYRICLGVYDNKFVIFWNRRSSCLIDMCVLEEVASESGKSLCCTEEDTIISFSFALKPLSIWRNEIVCFDERKVEGQPRYFLKLFNLTTRKWKEFHNFSAGRESWCYGFNYKRSLVSVCNIQVE